MDDWTWTCGGCGREVPNPSVIGPGLQRCQCGAFDWHTPGISVSMDVAPAGTTVAVGNQIEREVPPQLRLLPGGAS